ncbi:MAG: acryloyl-CoA reductase [Mucispirillum sp.]|nr:acryloyl-CoA reductase [Mucispirillum sp.]
MSTYRSFVFKKNNNVVTNDIVLGNTENLPAGDVLIKVAYSSVSSYDILYTDENGLYKGVYPYTPGVDAAGIVAESASNAFRAGDEVVVYGCGLGTDIPGGFGQFVRVKESSVINLPTGLSLKDSMTIGSDGIAAALAVMEIMAAGIQSNSKDVIVSGAAMGIGAFSCAILSECGYNVTAVTSKDDAHDFIKELGVKSVTDTEKFTDKTETYFLNERYVAAVDNLGGDVLNTIIRSVKGGATVAVCGASSGSEYFSSSVMPFILRGINLVGIDSLRCSGGLKREALYKLSGDWYLKSLPFLCNEISIFEIAEYLERIKNGSVKGKIVINHEI